MLKKLLKRKYMFEKYGKIDKEIVLKNKTNFIELLDKIESEFYNYDFIKDERYVCVGRDRFLLHQMQELYYTKEQCNELEFDINPTAFCIYSLIEIIVNPNFLNLNDYMELGKKEGIYKNKDVNSCRKIYDEYNANGIISLNERDYILHGLNMIKDSLEKCDENLNWI